MNSVLLDGPVPTTKYRTSCAAKHDKLGWPTGFALQYGETTYGFRSNSAEVLQEVYGWLPSGGAQVEKLEVDRLFSLRKAEPTGQRGRRGFHLAYQEWSYFARTESWENLQQQFLERALPDILLGPIADRTSGFFVGVLASQNGDRVAVLVESLQDAEGVRTRLQSLDYAIESSPFLVLQENGSAQPITLNRDPQPATAGDSLPLSRIMICQETDPKFLSQGGAALAMIPFCRGIDIVQQMKLYSTLPKLQFATVTLDMVAERLDKALAR